MKEERNEKKEARREKSGSRVGVALAVLLGGIAVGEFGATGGEAGL